MSKKDWFVMIPGVFFDERHLAVIGGGLSTYLFLRGRMDRKSQVCKTKIQSIAEWIEKSDRTVRGWLKDLERGGYIRVIHKQHHLQIHILDLPDLSELRPAEICRPEKASDRQKTADLNNPARQFSSTSPAETCRPLNMNVVPEVCSRVFIGGEGGTKPNQPPPTSADDFLRFCFKTHRAIHGFDLVRDPGDVERVGALVANLGARPRAGSNSQRTAMKLYRVAWILFQLDKTRPYLNKRSRTLALFCKAATINDYLGPAKKRMDAARQRPTASGRAPDSVQDLIEGQEFQPGPGVQKFWTRCLDHLQANLIETNFNQFFSALVPVSVTAEEITLSAPNKIHMKILNEHYLPAIQAAMATVDDVPRVIRIQITPGGRDQELKTRKEPQHA